MPSKLIVTLKDGTTIESDNLEHRVDMSGDLIFADNNSIDATKWKSVHVEEVKPVKKKKATTTKETAIES